MRKGNPHEAPTRSAGLAIDYPVSLSSDAPTGDIDISAGVDPTITYVSCKRAEIVGTGSAAELRFAQSDAIDSSSAVPLRLIGFKTTDAASDGNLIQYGGQSWAANPNGDGHTMYNTYYSGQFTAGAAAFPSALVQTYLSNQDQSHLFGDAPGEGFCTGGEWVDHRHAFCLTTGANSGAPVTVGKLADAFLYIPGNGYAAANVDSGGTGITVYSQLAANSSSDYSSVDLHPVVVANAATGFASTATSPASGGGFNDSLQVQDVPAPAGLTLNGLYIDPTVRGRFLVAASNTATGAATWATLSATSGTWALGAFSDFSAGVPSGYGEAASGCVYEPLILTSIILVHDYLRIGVATPLVVRAHYPNSTFKVLPNNSTLTWHSYDTSIVTVDSSGVATGQGHGQTGIAATYTDPVTHRVFVATTSFAL